MASPPEAKNAARAYFKICGITKTAACKLCPKVPKPGHEKPVPVQVSYNKSGCTGMMSHLKVSHPAEHGDVMELWAKLTKKKELEALQAVKAGAQFRTMVPMSKDDNSKALSLLALHCAESCRPLTTGAHGGSLSRLLEHVSGGRYKGHSASSVVTRSVVLNVIAAQKLSEALRAAESYSLTTDAWTCGTSYVGSTVHWVDTTKPIWCMRHACLHVQPMNESHTAKRLAMSVATAVDVAYDGGDAKGLVAFRKSMWGITGDGASAQQGAFALLGSEQFAKHINPWPQWCMCHRLHLTVKGGMSKVPGIAKMASKFKRLSAHIKRSTKAAEAVKAFNTAHKVAARAVTVDVVTRWTSTHECHVRLRENRAAIEHVQKDVQKDENGKEAKTQKNTLLNIGFSEEEADKILNQNVADDALAVTDSDWRTAELVEEVLVEFHSVSDVLSGDDYPTLGLVYPLVAELRAQLHEFEAQWTRKRDWTDDGDDVEKAALSNGIDFVNWMFNDLNDRFDVMKLKKANGVGQKQYVTAAYLHPCYKTMSNVSLFGGADDTEELTQFRKAARKFLRQDLKEVFWADDTKRTRPVPMWMQDALRAAERKHRAAPAERQDEQNPRKKKKLSDRLGAHAAPPPSEPAPVAEADAADRAAVPAGVFSRVDISALVSLYDKYNFPRELVDNMHAAKDQDVMLKAVQTMVKEEPRLAPVALIMLRYFSTPASSAGTERVWSKAGMVLSKLRRRLTGDNAAMLIKLGLNAALLRDTAGTDVDVPDKANAGGGGQAVAIDVE